MERLRSRQRKRVSMNKWTSFYNGSMFPDPPTEGDDFNTVWTEMINDITGNRPNWNPVSHVRMYSEPGSPPTFTRTNWFGPPDVGTWAGAWLPYDFRYDIPQLGIAQNLLGNLELNEGFIPQVDAAAFARKALDKALDQIPESVSIANFLIELREAKSLIPRLNGWQTGSDQFLNWNFGWSPLISDLKKFFTVVADVRARLEHLKKVNHRTVTLSHMRKFIVVDDQSPPPYTSTYVMADNDVHATTKTSYLQVDARINLKVSYDLDLGGSDAFMQAMCSALGLMNPTKIIWNAIPFSFVVDWLTNISDFLDDHTEIQPFRGTIAIRSADTSYKTKVFMDHWHPISDTEMGKFATTLVRGFYRRHGTPNRTIVYDGLTPMQQALATALILSNGGTSGHRRI